MYLKNKEEFSEVGRLLFWCLRAFVLQQLSKKWLRILQQTKIKWLATDSEVDVVLQKEVRNF